MEEKYILLVSVKVIW